MLPLDHFQCGFDVGEEGHRIFYRSLYLKRRKEKRHGDEAMPLIWVDTDLRLAIRILRSSRCCEHAGIRIAVGVVDCVGWRYTGKPLNECFILWVISEAIGGDWNGRVGQTFNHVSGFQVVLAMAVGRKPPRRCIVHERIIECFGKLVAERGDVNE